jgi:hypothetical protein
MLNTTKARIPSPEAIVAVRCPPAVAVLGLAAVFLYAVSFFLPACDNAAGYQAFVLSVVCVVGIPMWFANPFFWAGVALLSQGKYASAGKAGLVALVLALSECWLFAQGLQVGYYAWVGSMALLAAAGWCGAAEGRDGPVHGTRGAGEATRIAARFGASRPPFLLPQGQGAYQAAGARVDHPPL